MRLLRAG
jgi:hypothetical protein